MWRFSCSILSVESLEGAAGFVRSPLWERAMVDTRGFLCAED